MTKRPPGPSLHVMLLTGDRDRALSAPAVGVADGGAACPAVERLGLLVLVLIIGTGCGVP